MYAAPVQLKVHVAASAHVLQLAIFRFLSSNDMSVHVCPATIPASPLSTRYVWARDSCMASTASCLSSGLTSRWRSTRSSMLAREPTTCHHISHRRLASPRRYLKGGFAPKLASGIFFLCFFSTSFQMPFLGVWIQI